MEKTNLSALRFAGQKTEVLVFEYITTPAPAKKAFAIHAFYTTIFIQNNKAQNKQAFRKPELGEAFVCPPETKHF
ncbi:MAG: hypothetical protein U5L07_09290 [Desulfobacterales bacterium]|nr:hypothetical protein [Desulfobacterales bacterium]